MKADKNHNKEVNEFLKKSGQVNLPDFRKSKEEIWSEIDAETDDYNKKPLYWAAAVILLLAVSYFTFPTLLIKSNQISTKAGQIQFLELPDGSTVQLNAVSEISYSKEWDERMLHLKGEAFFEVEKGNKFIVETDLGTVEVLGTSFNVKVRKDQFGVECKTGRVKVSAPNFNFSEILDPGDRVTLDSGKIKLLKIDPVIIGSWQKGEFYYDNRPVKEVFDELERQFDIELTVSQTEVYRFTGYFSTKDLQTALTMICEPLDLSYAIISDNQVDVQPRERN